MKSFMVFALALALAIMADMSLPQNAFGAGCLALDKVNMLKKGMDKRKVDRICSRGCSTEDIDEMLDKGVREETILSVCEGSGDDLIFDDPYPQQKGPPPIQQAPIGTVCVTQAGTCPMMQPFPIGSSCYCMTPYGQYFGFVQ